MLSYLKSAPLNLSNCKISQKNHQKMLKFETKNALFGYCWGRFLKSYYYICNQHPWIYLIAYFHTQKNPKFGTKNALFGFFYPRILKSYGHIWNQHPRICLIAIFCKEEQKCLNLGPKMPYFSFLARILKK